MVSLNRFFLRLELIVIFPIFQSAARIIRSNLWLSKRLLYDQNDPAAYKLVGIPLQNYLPQSCHDDIVLCSPICDRVENTLHITIWAIRAIATGWAGFSGILMNSLSKRRDGLLLFTQFSAKARGT